VRGIVGIRVLPRVILVKYIDLSLYLGKRNVSTFPFRRAIVNHMNNNRYLSLAICLGTEAVGISSHIPLSILKPNLKIFPRAVNAQSVLLFLFYISCCKFF